MPDNTAHLYIAVVPTYNEAQNVVPLIADLLALPVNLDVVVVDDNSPDGTGPLVDEQVAQHPGRVHVLHRAGKLGLGTAHIEGWRFALKQSYRGVISMDADYSHHPRYIPQMIAQGEAAYDVVIGSRYVSGGGVVGSTLFRRLLSYGANSLARLALGVRAHDLTASFRFYRREVLTGMDLAAIRSDGYSFPIETAYLCQSLGWRIGEIPILFENRTRGASKVSRKEIYKALFTLLRLGGERLSGKRVQRVRAE